MCLDGLDELGPIAARRYSGPSWSAAAHRPHFRPSYARSGSRWAFGALAQRSGAVYVETGATRDTAAWLRFLDGVEAFAPPGDAYLIMDVIDALPLHWSVDTMRWNWGHPRFHFVPFRAVAQSRRLAQSRSTALRASGRCSFNGPSLVAPARAWRR